MREDEFSVLLRGCHLGQLSGIFFFFLLDAIYFIWFGVRYFYISISILVTCFVMQLSYLETVDPLGSLLPLG